MFFFLFRFLKICESGNGAKNKSNALTIESSPEFYREAFLQMAELPTHLLA